jgi:hypothetical protein
MDRRTRLTILSAGCLALAVGCASMAVATRGRGYHVAYGFGDRQQVYINTQAGTLSGGWRTLVVPYDGWAAYPINPRPLPAGSRLGFVWGWYNGSVIAGVPFWFLACVAAAVGGWSLWKRRAPPDPNCCPSCGYDVRATPERCPECGAAVR